jgi:hypothetical protein
MSRDTKFLGVKNWQTVPATSDWRSVASLAVDAVSSAHSKRAYQKASKDFVAWYSAEARPPFSRAVVQQYRAFWNLPAWRRLPSI